MDGLPAQMPINVAVEEPRASIVSDEAEGHLVTSNTGVNNVTDDRIVPVILGAARATDNPEGMLYASCKGGEN